MNIRVYNGNPHSWLQSRVKVALVTIGTIVLLILSFWGMIDVILHGAQIVVVRYRRPGYWLVLFDSRNRNAVARIQFVLAGMNAHIDHDLRKVPLLADSFMDMLDGLTTVIGKTLLVPAP